MRHARLLAVAAASAALVAPALPGGPAQGATSRTLPASIVATASPGSACSPSSNPSTDGLVGSYRQVESGYDFCLALTRAGTVEAISYDDTLVPPAGLTDVMQVSAGYRHALALDDTGHVTAFGAWDDGQQDDDGNVTVPAEPATVPQAVADATLVEVAAGYYHDLGITDDGKVVAWGQDPDSLAVQVPAELADETVVSVAAGANNSAAITDAGKLVVWGDFQDVPLPASLQGNDVVAVDLGYGVGMALTSTQNLIAWGSDYGGASEIPTAVQTRDVVAFGVGEANAMAATSDGRLFAWGEDVDQGVPPTRGAPVADLSVGRYSAVATFATLAPGTAPRIIGTPARVGRTLTGIEPASWSEAPEGVTYQWLRNGAAIAGATGTTYKLAPADVGRRISFAVTATGPAGYDDTRVVSAATPAVTLPSATFKVTTPTAVVRSKRASISATGLAAGERFTVTLDGRRVGSGAAGASGVARLTFTVPASTRLGSRPVVVTGSVSDRTGKRATTVRAR